MLNHFLILGFIIASIYFVIEKRSADVLIKKQYEKSLKRTNYPDVNILLYNYFDGKNKKLSIIMYDHDY